MTPPTPAYFSRMGLPSCSMWGKYEIECLAWAYVTGMAIDGDTWHKIDAKTCWDLLDEEARDYMSPYLDEEGTYYKDWWEMIGNQLTDAEGAFEVDGLAWNRRRFEEANKTILS